MLELKVNHISKRGYLPGHCLRTGIMFKCQSFAVGLVDHVCYGRQVSQVEGRGPSLPRRLWMVSGFEHVILIVDTEYAGLCGEKGICGDFRCL